MAKKRKTASTKDTSPGKESRGLSAWCLGNSCRSCPNNFESFTCSCICHEASEEEKSDA